MACRERNNALEVFVQVLDEPGLANGRALAPSFLRYPGDQKTVVPEPLGDSIWTSTMESDEGGRFINHTSRYALAWCDETPLQPEAQRGVWLTLSELKLLFRRSNLSAIQLRTAAALLLGAPDP